jgi:hypothetical protein
MLRDRVQHLHLAIGAIAMSINAMQSGTPASETGRVTSADKKGFDRTPRFEIGTGTASQAAVS